MGIRTISADAFFVAKERVVIPWTLIDRATVPGGGELRLLRRGDEFSIKLDQTELMNSRLGGSEEALATLACERIRDRPHARLLIGGLGMGFTLRTALAALGPQAKIDVAEIVPEVVAWARGPMAAIFGASLSDPRLRIVEDDVAALIAAGGYDAILLDVDNGPDGLSRPANDRLYNASGLGAAHAALQPGGVLAIWSSAPDPTFSKRLRAAGFSVDEKNVRARGKSGGARHVIWLATRS